jgi:hypothetical protein
LLKLLNQLKLEHVNQAVSTAELGILQNLGNARLRRWPDQLAALAGRAAASAAARGR